MFLKPLTPRPISYSVGYKNMKTAMHALMFMIFFWAIVACSKRNEDYELLTRKNIQCPDGAHLQYRGWGKSGSMAVCLLKHGPIVVAEHGHIIMEGQYAKGKKVGEWRWFDASGNIERTEWYDGTVDREN
ncbi:toxin-antitoxin system YwqK family antitoxin [Verminephrobacter aporrectodeae]|uniref:hypothetical protein n=2 Tax=Verminephrobacter aporrectodeae TaxID=1110389 RepID=UPI002244DF5A|nr:hypothetical protein [Verminephrobacter aporrectodeae]